MSGTRVSSASLGERLQDVTEALAAARTQGEVFGTVLRPALKALGAVAGAVLLVGEAGDRLELVASQGDGEGGQPLWQGLLLPADDALRRHEALYFEHEGDLLRAYPEVEARTGSLAVVATAALPMFLDGAALGVLVLNFTEPYRFTPEEKRFLRILAAQCALALGRVRVLATLTSQVETRTRELDAARSTAEVLAHLGDALQTAASPEEVARLALERLGPALSATGMNVVRLEGEQVQATTFWGDVPGRIRTFMTRPGLRLPEVPNLLHVARTRRALYFDDYGATAGPVPGFPSLSGAAEPILTPGGTLAGFVVAWRPAGTSSWREGQRDLLRRAAGTLGLALERAGAARQLEEERAALDAFVAYKEAVGRESDVLALARQAVQVVRANLEHVSAAYYERGGGLWRARVWSGDIAPEIVEQITAGVPADAPNYAEAARSGQPVFVDGWDAEANGVHGAASYGAAAFLPLVIGGETRGLFSVGTREARGWTERERALVRAVARGLAVTLERTEYTRQLDEERAALAAFARFTEASTHTTDPLTLAGEASAVLRATLNVQVGYSELEDGLWKGRVFSETTPPRWWRRPGGAFPPICPVSPGHSRPGTWCSWTGGTPGRRVPSTPGATRRRRCTRTSRTGSRAAC